MSDEETITRTLKVFFDEMGAWESWCAKRSRERQPSDKTPEAHEESKALSIAALRRIFEKYCTTWDEPQRAEGGGIHYSMIPLYGADLEEILEVVVSEDTARVVTKQKAGIKHTCIYYLNRTDSGWRIEDNRKRLNNKGVEVDYDL